MDRFLIDAYLGARSGREAAKAFSAYGSQPVAAKAGRAMAAQASERELAVEAARKIRERMREEAERKGQNQKKPLTELAKEAKKADSAARREADVQQLAVAQDPTDEELKRNLDMMKGLNEKMAAMQISGEPDKVLSSVLLDLF